MCQGWSKCMYVQDQKRSLMPLEINESNSLATWGLFYLLLIIMYMYTYAPQNQFINKSYHNPIDCQLQLYEFIYIYYLLDINFRMDFLFIKVYTCNSKSCNDLWFISNDQIEVHVLLIYIITPKNFKKL